MRPAADAGTVYLSYFPHIAERISGNFCRV